MCPSKNLSKLNDSCEDETEKDDDDKSVENENMKTKKGWSPFYITIEPIKFLVGFTMAFTNGVTIDLLERNICYRDYGLSFYECTSHNNLTEIKSEVERETAHVVMIKNIIEGVMPLFLTLFIGPWSDHNGRKPCLLWAIRGYVVYYLLWAIFSFFPHIPVIYFFIPSIPLSFTGAMITIYVCTWSYTCDNFLPEERTMRFGISIAAMVTGNLIGNALAEHVTIWGGEYGFPVVFVVSFLVSLISLAYTSFILEETIIRKKKDRGKLVDIKNVKSIFETVLIHPEKGRWLITFVLMVLCTEIPTHAGDEGILYLVGKSHFNWSLGRYNLFSGLSNLISAVLPVICIWMLMDIWKVPNPIVLVISSSILLVLELLKSISINETMFWAVSLISKSFIMIGPTIDAELADTVSEANVGKAFTFTSLMDALSPLLAMPLYTQIYKMLLPDKTIYVFFLSFGLTTITTIGSICLLLKKRQLQYSQSPTEPPSTEVEENCQETTPVNL